MLWILFAMLVVSWLLAWGFHLAGNLVRIVLAVSLDPLFAGALLWRKQIFAPGRRLRSSCPESAYALNICVIFKKCRVTKMYRRQRAPEQELIDAVGHPMFLPACLTD